MVRDPSSSSVPIQGAASAARPRGFWGWWRHLASPPRRPAADRYPGLAAFWWVSRELAQNSIEAIQRTRDKSGQIVWDVEWSQYDLQGVFKLALIDTGDGMTGDEMVKYIKHLSSSIAKQTLAGNYGVGAKVSAATRNHHGLIYLSWKEGKGAMIHLWRDPQTGQYGLRQFALRDPDGYELAITSPIP